MHKNINPSTDFITNPQADLHIHSIYSDGSFSPTQIINRARQFRLKAISITDHDNIDAIDSAKTISRQNDIEFIPGIEISSRHGKHELHLLGYFFDHQNKMLVEYVNFFQQERKKRARKIVEELNKIGVQVELEYVLKKAEPGSIGRPHIAHTLVENGFVASYQEAFNKYLGDNCPCYIPKYKISPAEAINLINHAGGLTFVAHPGLDLNETSILQLIKMGIEGIETIHPRHTMDQIIYYRKIISKYHLLECGGSDCHGNLKQDVMLGKVTISYSLVKEMKKWLALKAKQN